MWCIINIESFLSPVAFHQIQMVSVIDDEYSSMSDSLR